jgi:hypothetical protein
VQISEGALDAVFRRAKPCFDNEVAAILTRLAAGTTARRRAVVRGIARCERDAAGLAERRLLQQHDMTWPDLLTPASVKREPGIGTWRTTYAELAKRAGDLRLWERKFVEDLPAFRRLSSKQRYILTEIAVGLGGRHEPL